MATPPGASTSKGSTVAAPVARPKTGVGTPPGALERAGSGKLRTSPLLRASDEAVASPAGGVKGSGGAKVMAPPLRLDVGGEEEDEVSVFASSAAPTATAGDKPIKGAKRLGSAWRSGVNSPRHGEPQGSPKPANAKPPRFSSIMALSTSGPSHHHAGRVSNAPAGSPRTGPQTPMLGAIGSVAPVYDPDARLKRLEIQRVIAHLPRFAALARSADPQRRLDEVVRDAQMELAKEYEESIFELVVSRYRGKFFYLWRAAALRAVQRRKEALLAARLEEVAKARPPAPTRVASFKAFAGVSKQKRPPSFILTKPLAASTSDAAAAALTRDNDEFPLPPTTPIDPMLLREGARTPPGSAPASLSAPTTHAASPPPSSIQAPASEEKRKSRGLLPRILSRREKKKP